MAGRKTRQRGEDMNELMIDTHVLDDMISNNPKRLADVVTTNAYRILAKAQTITPRDPARPPQDPSRPVSGELRANVDVTRIDTIGLTQAINYYQEYAIYQELGAPANNMPARPFLTPSVEGGADKFYSDIAAAINREYSQVQNWLGGMGE
jgi:hypothetical protein